MDVLCKNESYAFDSRDDFQQHSPTTENLAEGIVREGLSNAGVQEIYREAIWKIQAGSPPGRVSISLCAGSEPSGVPSVLIKAKYNKGE